jgi:hypothetical protein
MRNFKKRSWHSYPLSPRQNGAKGRDEVGGEAMVPRGTETATPRYLNTLHDGREQSKHSETRHVELSNRHYRTLFPAPLAPLVRY